MDEGGAVAGLVGQDVLESADLGVGQQVELHLHPHRRSAVDRKLGAGDVHGDDLGCVVAHVEPALDHDDRVFLEQVSVLAHRLGEHHHLERGTEILEHEGSHEVAALGVLPVERGDDAADRAHLAFTTLS